MTPEALRARRALERCEALARLGVPEVALHRLGIPDQGCADRVGAIAVAIRDIIEPGDVVVTPSRHDRHPDHVAVARATRCAGASTGMAVWEAPTWALVHGTAAAPTATLQLDDVTWLAKQHAVAAYRSQLDALGPEPDDELLEALEMLYAGALLRAGMGYDSYGHIADRLEISARLLLP